MDNLCRICLDAESENSLLETELLNVFCELSRIEVSVLSQTASQVHTTFHQLNKNDNLPLTTCPRCTDELLKYHDFKLKIIENDKILKQMPRSSKRCDSSGITTEKNKCGDRKSGGNTFTCETCHKTVGTLHSLKRHVKIHTGNKTHTCEVCEKSFLEAGNLRKHIKKHMQDRKHRCNECGVGFYERNKLAIHTRTHTGEKPYNCDVCAKSFGTSAQVRVHKKVTVSTFSHMLTLPTSYNISEAHGRKALQLPHLRQVVSLQQFARNAQEDTQRGPVQVPRVRQIVFAESHVG